MKALMLRKKIDGKRSELARLLEKDTELERREAELIQAVEEARTEEEKQVVEEGVSAYEAEKAAMTPPNRIWNGRSTRWRPSWSSWSARLIRLIQKMEHREERLNPWQ